MLCHAALAGRALRAPAASLPTVSSPSPKERERLPRLWAGKIALWIKRMPYKYEGLSWKPQRPHKLETLLTTPALRSRAEPGNSQALPDQPAYPNQCAPESERLCSPAVFLCCYALWTLLGGPPPGSQMNHTRNLILISKHLALAWLVVYLFILTYIIPFTLCLWAFPSLFFKS